MELSYTRVGDYYLPNLKLSDPPDAPPIGRYGHRRRAFLKEHRPILFSRLVLTERLFPHLRDVDEAARQRLKTIPDRSQAAEVINELIYE